MKAPESLETLVDYGIIQEVVRPLMSGKEAQVYVVLAGGEECVAKVYKEAHQRTFKHRSDYTEGRRTRSTRDQRAMSKRSQHGRKKDEDAWRTTEVEMIHRLRHAGVRVPEVINFVEGVLVMEFVKDGAGDAAPRLGDLTFSPSEAIEIYQTLIREVVRMLCAGVIHGDLSDFNVLMSDQGPVVIDFPQSVDPTHNPNSQKLLLRDVENLQRFLRRFAPDEPVLPYGEEIWSLFQANRLAPDTELSGRYQAPKAKADTEEVMALIEDASRDNQMRRGARDEDDLEELDGSPTAAARAPDPFRRVVDFSGEKQRRPTAAKPEGKTRDARRTRRRGTTRDERLPPSGPAADSTAKSDASAPRRRRRSGGSARERVGDVPEPAPRSESTTADADRPANPKSRRRNRRGRSRSGTSAQAKPERADRGSDSSGEPGERAREHGVGRKAGQAGQRGAAKRPANPRSSSASTRAAGEGVGSGRPSRRRRRRPRKASSPR
jgi:RIO kinase 1